MSFLSFSGAKLKEVLEKFKHRPSGLQCRKFFSILSLGEKRAFLAFSVLAAGSFLFLSFDVYFQKTKLESSVGGSFIEGVVGQPRFLNPVLSPVNDVDRDITQLLFAGLMKYSSQGQIVPDLAQDYQVSQDGKTWDVTLKEKLSFHDGSPLTSDDVIFTVKTIQNPDYKSPLRPAWVGVEAEKMSDLKVRFRLKNPFPGFLENLTLKIVPEKTWQEISPESFPLSNFNLNPIGSGPYRLTKIVSDQNGKKGIKSLTLEINPSFGGEKPFLREITFEFFENEKDLAQAAKNHQVQNLVLPGQARPESFDGFTDLRFQLPRYFAVFFNPKSNPVLADQSVRQALTLATNKREIIEKALNGMATAVNSPLLPDIFGLPEPQTNLRFSLKRSADLLEKAGFKTNPATGLREKEVKKVPAFQFKSRLSAGSSGAEVRELQKCLAKYPDIYPDGEVTGGFGQKTKEAVIKFQEKYRVDVLTPAGLTQPNGEVGTLTRQKLNELCVGPTEQKVQLKFSLVTVEDPILLKVAALLKEQWKMIGAEVEIKAFPFNQLNADYLRPRNYDSLLFGEVLGEIPDPFPFWHSLQAKDPGLNLALYENKDADKLLADARQIFDEGLRKEKYAKFQEILLKDAPAVFLYRPDFIYLTSPKIRGIDPGFISDPSQRFAGIDRWYIKSKRVWK